MAPSVIVWLSTATVSSPTTLLVSRNVAIDCVQLQVRVHSAQQQSRALLASLPLSKMTVSFVCVYFWATFPAGAKTATLLGPIRLQPAPVATPAVGHRHQHQHTVTVTGANCVEFGAKTVITQFLMNIQQLPLLMLYLSLLAATLTLDLCCFPPGLCS